MAKIEDVRNNLKLRIVINKKGSDAVISEYPTLLEIILNLDSIYEESEKWLKLKM